MRHPTWRRKRRVSAAAAELPAVRASTEARAAFRELVCNAGPLIVVHPRPCRGDGAPVVVPRGEFPLGPSDVCIGHLEDVAVYVHRCELDEWDRDRPDLELDVEPGPAEGFSLAASGGRHFVSRWSSPLRRQTRAHEAPRSPRTAVSRAGRTTGGRFPPLPLT